MLFFVKVLVSGFRTPFTLHQVPETLFLDGRIKEFVYLKKKKKKDGLTPKLGSNSIMGFTYLSYQYSFVLLLGLSLRLITGSTPHNRMCLLFLNNMWACLELDPLLCLKLKTNLARHQCGEIIHSLVVFLNYLLKMNILKERKQYISWDKIIRHRKCHFINI